MVRKTLIAAAPLCILSVAHASAQALGAGEPTVKALSCENRINDLESEFGDVVENRAYGSAQMVLGDLRNAALRLNTQQMDDACKEAAEALEAALTAYRAARPEAGEIVPSTELGEIDERAVAFADAGIDTSRVVGADLYNYDNDYLGEISGVMMDSAQPTHVIVGEGGFWDRGSSQAAVPVSMLRWDPEWKAFFVPITSEALKEAPDYRTAAGDWNAEENDRYFEGLSD